MALALTQLQTLKGHGQKGSTATVKMRRQQQALHRKRGAGGGQGFTNLGSQRKLRPSPAKRKLPHGSGGAENLQFSLPLESNLRRELYTPRPASTQEWVSDAYIARGC